MRQLLSTVLAAHWAAVFAVLAFLSVSEPQLGGLGVFQAIGLSGPHEAAAGGIKAAAMLGLCFAVAAALFLWMFAACVFGQVPAKGAPQGEDCRAAFACGVAALGLLAVAVLLERSGGQTFLAVECLLAAVLLSYLAVGAEQFSATVNEARGSAVHTAHDMALEAAHHTMLSQIAGRADDVPAGRT